MKNFKTDIDGARTMSVLWIIDYLHAMLSGEALKEFDNPTSQNNGPTNARLRLIQECLLMHFPPDQCQRSRLLYCSNL